MSKTWEKLSAHDKVIAVHVDISNNHLFAGMSGVVYVGDVKITKDIPTAGTDGRDVWYGEDFVNSLSRKQLRFVALHEAMHKALQHCTNYMAICDKYPQLSNIAMDYVVNATIDETDPQHTFIEWTTKPEPLLDKKYYGHSFIEVLQDLLRNTTLIKVSVAGQGEGETGDGDGTPIPLDEHVFGKINKDSEAGKKLGTQIDDALRQGKILAEKLAGKRSLGSAIDRLTQKRDTNWREHMREWVTALCEGDEYSRFAPPNKRLLPLGVVMPIHQVRWVVSILLCSVRLPALHKTSTLTACASYGGTRQYVAIKRSSLMSLPILHRCSSLLVVVALHHRVLWST